MNKYKIVEANDVTHTLVSKMDYSLGFRDIRY
jgi:hypothetical protein